MKGWGENGYIRIKRGVGMCGIGKSMVTLDCEAVAGPTDAPLTTEAPCDDKFSNCPALAEKSCYKVSWRAVLLSLLNRCSRIMSKTTAPRAAGCAPV